MIEVTRVDYVRVPVDDIDAARADLVAHGADVNDRRILPMENMLGASQIDDFVASQRFGKKDEASQGSERKNEKQVRKQSLAQCRLPVVVGQQRIGRADRAFTPFLNL